MTLIYWRIIHTIGHRLTKVNLAAGSVPKSGAAVSILFSTFLKLPVSTTHITADAVAGVGSVQRVKAVAGA